MLVLSWGSVVKNVLFCGIVVVEGRSGAYASSSFYCLCDNIKSRILNNHKRREQSSPTPSSNGVSYSRHATVFPASSHATTCCLLSTTIDVSDSRYDTFTKTFPSLTPRRCTLTSSRFALSPPRLPATTAPEPVVGFSAPGSFDSSSYGYYALIKSTLPTDGAVLTWIVHVDPKRAATSGQTLISFFSQQLESAAYAFEG